MENRKPGRGGLREFLRFAQVTCLAMAVEMLSFLLLKRGLLLMRGSMQAGELPSTLAFLASSVVANALSFILNRKKTFHSRNSLRYAVPVYVGYSALMFALQTGAGPLLESALFDPLGKGAAVTAKALMMGMSLCISYPVNKYIIMRPDAGKKRTA